MNFELSRNALKSTFCFELVPQQFINKQSRNNSLMPCTKDLNMRYADGTEVRLMFDV